MSQDWNNPSDPVINHSQAEATPAAVLSPFGSSRGSSGNARKSRGQVDSCVPKRSLLYRNQIYESSSTSGSNLFFPHSAANFNPYSNLGSPAAWPYAFNYNEFDPYSYNQAGSLTDLLSPIHFDMPTSRAGMVIQNYGGAYTMASSKKRTGGRRPKEEEEQVQGLSAEEREKRQLRRVRNKEAAARCRQRRLNHMQALQAQVDALTAENKKQQREIEILSQEREELAYLVENHANCTMKGSNGTKPTFMAPMQRTKMQLQPMKVSTPPVKVEPQDPTLTQVTVSEGTEGFNTLTASALSRPSSLPFDTPNTPGVPIQTPTAGFGGFDLLGQSTGLTPVTNTGLTPISFLGNVTTSGSMCLETPTGMDTSAGVCTTRVATTLHNL